MPGIVVGGFTIVPGPTLVPNYAVGPPVLRRAYRRRMIPMTTPTNAQNIVGLSFAKLTFTGPTNLTISTTKSMTGVLTFIGALKNAITTSLTSAMLSFTGVFTKQINKVLTGILSFTSSTNLIKAINKGITAILSFTGPIKLKNVIAKNLTTAVLSFVGSTVKQLSRALTAILNFTGVFVKQAGKNLTGTLSFVGTQSRAISKTMTANLSFVGVRLSLVTKDMIATLSFVGSITKQARKVFTAVLSFVGTLLGVLSGVHQFFQNLSANLSFVGSLPQKRVGKTLEAFLNFIGFLPTPQPPAPTVAFPGNLLTTIPPSQDIALTETMPYIVNLSNYLSGSDTIGPYFMSLIILPGGQPVDPPWRLATTVVGNIMTITLLGSALQLGQQYQLRVTFVANINKTLTFLTYFNVVGTQ